MWGCRLYRTTRRRPPRTPSCFRVHQFRIHISVNQIQKEITTGMEMFAAHVVDHQQQQLLVSGDKGAHALICRVEHIQRVPLDTHERNDDLRQPMHQGQPRSRPPTFLRIAINGYPRFPFGTAARQCQIADYRQQRAFKGVAPNL